MVSKVVKSLTASRRRRITTTTCNLWLRRVKTCGVTTHQHDSQLMFFPPSGREDRPNWPRLTAPRADRETATRQNLPDLPDLPDPRGFGDLPDPRDLPDLPDPRDFGDPPDPLDL